MVYNMKYISRTVCEDIMLFLWAEEESVFLKDTIILAISGVLHADVFVQGKESWPVF